MKHCLCCNTSLAEEAVFCPKCGTDQRYIYIKDGHTTIKLLANFTIIGSIFQFIRGVFYELVADFSHNDEYIRGWIYCITAIITLVGAVMMMQRKMKGLYVYTIGQVIYIVTGLLATVSYLGEYDVTQSTPIIWIAAIFIIPAIFIQYMFWIKKDYFKKVM